MSLMSLEKLGILPEVKYVRPISPACTDTTERTNSPNFFMSFTLTDGHRPLAARGPAIGDHCTKASIGLARRRSQEAQEDPATPPGTGAKAAELTPSAWRDSTQWCPRRWVGGEQQAGTAAPQGRRAPGCEPGAPPLRRFWRTWQGRLLGGSRGEGGEAASVSAAPAGGSRGEPKTRAMNTRSTTPTDPATRPRRCRWPVRAVEVVVQGRQRFALSQVSFPRASGPELVTEAAFRPPCGMWRVCILLCALVARGAAVSGAEQPRREGAAALRGASSFAQLSAGVGWTDEHAYCELCMTTIQQLQYGSLPSCGGSAKASSFSAVRLPRATPAAVAGTGTHAGACRLTVLHLLPLVPLCGLAVLPGVPKRPHRRPRRPPPPRLRLPPI